MNWLKRHAEKRKKEGQPKVIARFEAKDGSDYVLLTNKQFMHSDTAGRRKLEIDPRAPRSNG